MIETCIVHIGMHKTGSSSIQQSLSGVKTSEFEYLNLGSPNHSSLLSNIFCSSPYTYHENIRLGLSKSQINERIQSLKNLIDNALAFSISKHVIISGEDLSSPHITIEGLTQLKILLLKYCKKIQVIGYVRPPLSYMQSAFQQRLKGGVQNNHLDNLYTLWPPYKARFERFDLVFGQENVELIPFMRDYLLSDDIVKDFKDRIGLKLDCLDAKRANESLSLEATALLFIYRRTIGNLECGYMGKPADDNKLIKKLMSIGSQKLKFGKELWSELEVLKKEDISWINKRLSIDLTDFDNHGENCINSESDLIEIALDNFHFIDDLFNDITESFKGEKYKIALYLQKYLFVQILEKIDFNDNLESLLLNEESLNLIQNADTPYEILKYFSNLLSITGYDSLAQKLNDFPILSKEKA